MIHIFILIFSFIFVKTFIYLYTNYKDRHETKKCVLSHLLFLKLHHIEIEMLMHVFFHDILLMPLSNIQIDSTGLSTNFYESE
jgi:hypothetical protein